MASFRVGVIATGFLVLVIFALSDAHRPTLHKFKAPANHTNHAPPNATVTPQGRYDGCRARHIVIQQGEVSGVGIPTWQVQIINECTDPLCAISQVIVHCGAFHSPRLVNPKLFRRLDANAGTCIVNDGNRIPNANAITFEYSEIWKQPLTLQSARVTCSG